MNQWTLWSEIRPTDPTVTYRWRIPVKKICGMMLRPEWSSKLSLVGMGYAENEWWPLFSDWNGYTRSVKAGLEWRVAEPDEKGVLWSGLELSPCPFTGNAPRVSYVGRWSIAPPYEAESLGLHAWLVDRSGFRDASEMAITWNRRASAPASLSEGR